MGTLQNIFGGKERPQGESGVQLPVTQKDGCLPLATSFTCVGPNCKTEICLCLTGRSWNPLATVDLCVRRTLGSAQDFISTGPRWTSQITHPGEVKVDAMKRAWCSWNKTIKDEMESQLNLQRREAEAMEQQSRLISETEVRRDDADAQYWKTEYEKLHKEYLQMQRKELPPSYDSSWPKLREIRSICTGNATRSN